MKLITLTICALSFLILSCNDGETTKTDSTDSTSTEVTDKKADEPFTPVDSATAMRNWQAYMTPGKEHEMLAKSNGTWDAEVTMWMEAGAPPMTSKATANNKMILGGRYQQGTFKGDMMGMSFEGMSTTGFDNAKKLFFSTWVDNLGTGVMKMEGPWDEATKTMTLTGTGINPADGKECNMKETFKIVDDNTQVMEMFGPDPKTGKQYKNMEIKFTKKK